MRKTRLVMGLVFLLPVLHTLAQQGNDWRLEQGKDTGSALPNDTLKPGTVEIIADDGIVRLVKRHIAISDSLGTIPGYRLQIFSASGPDSKTKAKKVQAQFMKKHRDTPACTIFQTPNFKVRVGDFRTKLEAEKFKREILKEFTNAFIVKDDIELPKIE